MEASQNLGIVQPPTIDDDVVRLADVADYASFNIEDGVLTFKSPPSYEADSAGTTYPGIADDSKTYRVVVQASDGGATDKLSWFKVTVTVTDEEEKGKVSWTVDHDGKAMLTLPEADAVPGRRPSWPPA